MPRNKLHISVALMVVCAVGALSVVTWIAWRIGSGLSIFPHSTSSHLPSHLEKDGNNVPNSIDSIKTPQPAVDQADDEAISLKAPAVSSVSVPETPLPELFQFIKREGLGLGSLWAISMGHDSKEYVPQLREYAIAQCGEFANNSSESGVMYKNTLDRCAAFINGSQFVGNDQIELLPSDPMIGVPAIAFCRHEGGVAVVAWRLASGTVFNEIRLDAVQRASRAANTWIIRLLDRLHSDFATAKIDWVCVGISWGVRDFSSDYSLARGETLFGLVRANTVAKYTRAELTRQQLLAEARWYFFESGTHSPRLVEIGDSKVPN